MRSSSTRISAAIRFRNSSSFFIENPPPFHTLLHLGRCVFKGNEIDIKISRFKQEFSYGREIAACGDPLNAQIDIGMISKTPLIEERAEKNNLFHMILLNKKPHEFSYRSFSFVIPMLTGCRER